MARGLRRHAAGEVDCADALSSKAAEGAVDAAALERQVLPWTDVLDFITGVRARRKEIGLLARKRSLRSRSTPVQVLDRLNLISTTSTRKTSIQFAAWRMYPKFASSMLTSSRALPQLALDSGAFGPFVAVVYERKIDVAAERERLTKDIAKYEKGLASAERQLGNDGFLAKAPVHVVEGLKKQEAETRLLLEKARAAFDALPE